MNVLSLKPGDRVILYSPELESSEARCMAVYDGTFESLDQAMRSAPKALNLVCKACADWLNSGIPWARFILLTRGPMEAVAALRVGRDGSLTDQDGHMVLVEERLFVGVG